MRLRAFLSSGFLARPFAFGCLVPVMEALRKGRPSLCFLHSAAEVVVVCRCTQMEATCARYVDT
jgi:hypothetical protein